MRIGTIDLTQLRGFADKAFGLTKEVLGALIGNEGLQREGEAQQERATEELKAFQKQVEAQRHEAAAATLEAQQRSAQKAKAS